MDIPFIITCLILLSFTFVPVYILNNMGRKKGKSNIAKTKLLIKERGLVINQTESWGDYYIGIDTTNKKLVFINHKTEVTAMTEQLVDLTQISTCNIVENRKAKKINGRNESVLEKLDLEIQFKDGKNLLIPFYDARNNQMENWEMKRIEKWKALVTENVLAPALIKKAA